MRGKRALLLMIVFLLAGMTAFAGTDAKKDEVYGRYSGMWFCDDYILELRFEEGEMTGSLMLFEDSGDTVVWEFTSCMYVPDEDYLWCNGCTHYRNHIDPKTMEVTEEDWWLTDLSDIYFAFGDDADTLMGYDIDGTDGPLAFRREEAQAAFDI